MPDTAVDDLQARRAKVLARLGTKSPERKNVALTKALAAVEKAKPIWRDGIVPPTFDEFFTLLDGTTLYPRQYETFAKAGLLDPYSVIDQERNVQELILAIGKGGGKDMVIAKLFAWIAYVVCHLEGHPALHFGLKLPTAKLSVMNVAPSEDLARTTFFEPYLSVFLKHPMFDKFAPRILTDSIAFSRIDPVSKKPYTFLDLLSKHSNSGGLDGYNLLAWVMDEADGFKDLLGRSTAETVHKILRSSCGSRMNQRWIGAIISYIRVAEGFMERMRARAEAAMKELGEKSSYFTDTAASWDWNLSISREDSTIAEDYKNDPVDAAARYECRGMATIDGFFEFPERIDSAVDHDKRPCAVVDEKHIEIETHNGGTLHYISAEVSHESMRPVPGYTYFLGCDAGEKGDAFVLALGHVDDQSSAFSWLCPRCGRDAALRGGARYDLQLMNAVLPCKAGETPPMCGACLEFADQVTGGMTMWKVSVANWYKRAEGSESVVHMKDGSELHLGTIYEDLIIRIVPSRATREGEVNRTVYFPGMLDLCKDLILGMSIYSGRFDPWQTTYITQSLKTVGSGNFEEMKFGQKDQYNRATLGKMMLYNNLLVLIECEHRDREWRRLQRIHGNKIDHPKGVNESKDVFDAEMEMIWQAATYKDSKVEVMFS